ncbi:quercetin dioxygenase-like cupin family protein [Phycicoccus badiiscoriae]|uniref:Quercetin dioxygenase-like cupin family protein n=1 Tax=Pedococcus badiiscoriae TaxID=642776 RepID=A0A852WBY0_9MICO|nr:cupin domain-containing protein [Pedococcus badiiscoriae]NYG06309.1 quercetin dioxygenase-like cupin family protein [Pedococcus badiiscoriae]
MTEKSTTATHRPLDAGDEPPPRAVFRAGGTARATWAMGSLFEHLLTAEESGGTLGVALVTQPPGIATPLHRHQREAEAFFLLDGAMTYRAGDEVFHLVGGDFIWLPPNLPHAFRVTGDRPVRFVGLADPGHLFGLYDEVGLPASERRLPGPDGRPMEQEIPRWNAVGPRYGLEVLGPPLPEES